MWVVMLWMIKVGWSASLDDVYALQRQGKYIEAQEVLDDLLLNSEVQTTPQLRFEWARNLELQGQYEPALEMYNELYILRVAGDFGLNVAYRRGLVLSNLGQHRAAIRTLKRLRWRKLTPKDRRGVQLALGAAEIEGGLVERGMKRIEKTLLKLEQPNEWSWLQARARMAICRYLISKAQQTPLEASVDLKTQMDDRANWILQADKQIQVIIQLQEPEYVLLGLEEFADSMVVFFDALRMLPPPVDFTDAQAEIFAEEIARQSKVLAEKALGYYQLAVRFGDGLAWTGACHPRMERKIEVLEGELRRL